MRDRKREKMTIKEEMYAWANNNIWTSKFRNELNNKIWDAQQECDPIYLDMGEDIEMQKLALSTYRMIGQKEAYEHVERIIYDLWKKYGRKVEVLEYGDKPHD